MPVIELVHPFVSTCLDFNALLKDCTKLSTFCARLEKQAKDSFDVDKYKGDGFELLVEALIKLSPVDKRIGISDYRPIISSNTDVEQDIDVGVDGVGIGLNGKPATVQIKYRQADYILTANKDHLTNFTSISLLKYGVRAEDEDNMLIVTTAKDLHYQAHEDMFMGKVRTLNRIKLRQMLDDNCAFWRLFLQLWGNAKVKIAEEAKAKNVNTSPVAQEQ